MIIGRFGDTSGRPFIEGRLILPRLNVRGDISFLLDTGADSSIIMPGDAQRLGVPFDRLQGDHECGGIGGTIRHFAEQAVLVFSDSGVALYAYELQIAVMPNDPGMEEVPSLLGRDVVDRWRITYDPNGTGLRAKPRSADRIFNLPSPADGNLPSP